MPTRHFRPARFRGVASGPPLSLYFAIACAVMAAPGGRVLSADFPAADASIHDYRLPVSTSRLVDRFGTTAPPEVLAFWEGHGRASRIYWDSHRGTPRLLRPLEPVNVASPGLLAPSLDRETLILAVEAYLDENAAFLGVDSTCLAEPEIHRVGSRWVLVFGQTTKGSIPLRGASLRIVLREDGTLAWIEAFLARGCPEPRTALITREEVEAILLSAGASVRSAKLQIGFAELPAPLEGQIDPGDMRPIPIWSVLAADLDGEVLEHIVDSVSGEVMARRRARKYFDPQGEREASGSVVGRAPDRGDIFTSPIHTLDPGLITETPLEGITIREFLLQPVPGIPAIQALGVTDEEGLFEKLPVRGNPANLFFALENGRCIEERVDPLDPASPFESRYEMLLQVTPISSSVLEPFVLPPSEDVDSDGVPDVSLIEPVTREFNVVFNPGTGLGEDYVIRAWWLQCYVHAQRMLRVARRTMDRFDLREPAFRLEPLRVMPSLNALHQFYDPPEEGEPAGRIISAMTFKEHPGAHEENVVPTKLLHEVGHHIFHSITRSREREPIDLEDGVADVLAAFTNRLCLMFFAAKDTPTSASFCLGTTEPDWRNGCRAAVGDGFWRLSEILVDERDRLDVAYGLLLHWLALHRSENGGYSRFECGPVIVEELLDIDTSWPFCTRFEAGCRTPPHELQILRAFGESLIFDEPFVRGDANIDRKVDVGDAITILEVLFAGEGRFHHCWNAVDVDDNSELEITDPIYLLNFLFRGGPTLPPPYPKCGFDGDAPLTPGNLGCIDFTCPL